MKSYSYIAAITHDIDAVTHERRKQKDGEEMKVGKPIRALLSFILAFTMIMPGAAKVDAADYHAIDPGSTILDAVGLSTNKHTFAKAIWTLGDYAYLMIDSTHSIEDIKIGGVSAVELDEHAIKASVTVDSTVFYPDDSSGNTGDSRLTIGKFLISQIGMNETGKYSFSVKSDFGGGHDIVGGTLTIKFPKAKVTVSKQWEGGPKKPVEMQLYREYRDGTGDEKVGAPFTLSTDNASKTFTDLKYTDNFGRYYQYYVEEINLGSGYTPTYTVIGPELKNGVYVFTIKVKNTYSPPVTDIKITKIWKDGTPDERPQSITFNLYADGGAQPVRTESTDSSKSWMLTFKDLPVTDNNGKAIVYTVKEDPVPGYVTSIDGFTVTNVRTEKTSIDVTKLWKDDGGPARPQSVTFNLLANGSKVKDIQLTEAGGWKATFTDIPKFDVNGKLISYTITEETVPGYKGSVDGFTITNTRTEKTSIPVVKLWKDDGPEGRPSKVVINLMAGGNIVKSLDLTAAMDWKGSFTDVDKFDSEGDLISYTIKEEAVEGYKTDIKGFEATNTRVGKGDIKVEKSWLDDGDASGRPPFITIYLYAGDLQVDSVNLTAEMNWQHTFKDKPLYTLDGKAIKYTIKEKAVEGYETTIDGFKVKNLRVGKTEVSVEKTWKDDNDVNSRPLSITVNLLANGIEVKDMAVTKDTDWKYTFKDLPKYDDQGKLIVYTITEDAVPGYESSVDGLKITNTRTGKVDIPVEKIWKDENAEGRPVSIRVNLLANGVEVAEKDITSEMEWKYTFADMKKFDDMGKVITYTITEDAVPGYKGKVDGFKITNTRVGDRDIPVEKIWKDNGDTSARPLKITVSLLAGGKVVDTAEITKEMSWTYKFTDKPVYDKDGKTITYTIKENEIAGYVSKVEGFKITNTRVGEIDIPVEKKWLDNGERDIEEITVRLMKEVVSMPPVEVDNVVSPQAVAIVEVDTLKLNEGNDWMDTFKDLPEFDENGRPISYFVEEVEVPGYASEVEENEDGSYTITNTRTGITSVEGMKHWMDEEGTSQRPETITVILLQNGEEIDRMDIGEEDEWSFRFEELDEFDEKGIAYEYTIDEAYVDGYETRIDGFDIHNLRVGEIDIPVEKIWKDNGVRDIEEITVHLYRKMHEMDRIQSEMTLEEMIDHTHAGMAVLSEENEWKFTFENLPEFDEHGMPIEYFLKEVSVEGYESTIILNEDGSFTVTNTRVGIVDVEGDKTWFDEGEEERPEAITVILNRNGEELDRVDVTAEDEWSFSFTDLPEFDEDGIAYTYEVEELPVEGYNTFYAGYDIQNVRTGMVNVNGEKTWDDLFGRPESIVINLLQNGVEIDEVTLSPEDDEEWTYSFTELPEFDEEGIAYIYTVTEDPVEGYEAAVEGYDILNRQQRATLRIIKVDDFDFPVEDVVFEVEDEEGNIVFRGTTDEDGILETVLPLGTYIVTEISAPADYMMDPEPKTVVLDEDGEVLELTVVNILEIEEVEPKPLPPTPKPQPKPQLPSTGSANSTIFYGLGILMALGGLLLLRKRRTV